MSDHSPANGFVHLRLHTEYSIRDSIISVNPLVNRAADMKMPAIAVTDLANLFGLIKFYTSAINSGIKPICGCDAAVLNDEAVESHLILLVKDKTGYLNLTRLISKAYTGKITHKEFYIKKSWLNEYSEGLIALSGARRSDIGKAILEDDKDKAAELLQDWMEYFPDSFYLEVQRTGRADEEKYIEGALELALKAQCPVVATNDVCFLSQDDFDAHEVRVCINERRTLDDPRRSHRYSDQQYLRSPQEMRVVFADIPEAIENSVEIAKRCNLQLTLDQPHLPNYPIPDGVSIEQYFRDLSQQGLQRRLNEMQSLLVDDFESKCEIYRQRLDTELDIIIQMGYPGYYLIVMEFIQWARDNEIPVGPGRGSGAGSIVAYALGITDIDPLKYDLLFERFLNPERISMPDFDVDFCMEGRDLVIQHVAELYGKEAVSQIITFGTMAAKAVVRDVARVQGKSYALADKLSKLIPFEPGMTLKKALEQEPQLKEFIDGDEDAQEIMEMAFKLEGITRNVGKHAGGVVIAPTRLTDFAPLYCDENGESLVTQFDMNDVETAGLVKFDFLGLRTLTIIDWAVKMINEDRDEDKINIDRLPLDDPAVYELLKNAKTTAVFQLESRGMKDLIKRLQPSCFEDIIALVALFRPGPLQSGMVDDFINRKHGRAAVNYPHEELEPVLKNTYGVILYQEQVMQIAQVLANYTLGGADMLRRAMGKKKPQEMEYQRGIFIEGARHRKVPEKLAGSIFDLMEKFAGYGFNKSHSAAYAMVSYQTAWLKTHYPVYFMAAVLSADMQNTDKVVTLIDECRSMGIPLVHPNVNTGNFNFSVNEKSEIVYGLGAIKGLGEGPVSAIVDAREQGGVFVNLLDFCSRVDPHHVNKRTMEALIKCGSLDDLHSDGSTDQKRATLMAGLAENMRAAEQSFQNLESGVGDLFGEIAPVESKGSHGLTAARVRPWSEQQRLAAEKETLGLYLSGHPIDEYLPEITQLVRERIVSLKPEKDPQLVIGLVYSVRTMKSKRGDSIAYLTLDDKSGRIEIALFAKEYEMYRDLLGKDAILAVECLISVDDYSGGMRGKTNEILTLQELREKRAKSITLRLREEELIDGFCDQLTAILSPYIQSEEVHELEKVELVTAAVGAVSGAQLAATPEAVPTGQGDSGGDGSAKAGCPVVIHYGCTDYEGCIMLGQQWNVSPVDDLIEKLKTEYGRNRVSIQY